MDKKLINEDIKNIQYLFGYKPGRVISEQDFDYTTEMDGQEEPENDRYMFFSNLQQIHRQMGILLEKDPEMIHSILENGHDWAQDHIATAKESIDQVFDFIMNEEEGDNVNVLEQDYSSDTERPTSDRERQAKSLFGDKYGAYIPNDVIRYIRKNPAQFIKKIYQMYGDKVYDYLDKVKS
jgi:hypothetical protein